MGFEETLATKLHLASKRDQQAYNRITQMNDLIDDIKTVCAENDVNEFTSEYGTIKRISGKQLTGRNYDRAQMALEFPDLDVAQFGVTTCNDPHQCYLKPVPNIEAILAGLGPEYSEADKTRMRELMDIQTLPDYFLIHTTPPEPDPPCCEDFPECECEEDV